MTPEFWEVHSGLPREGPGEPADVAWATERAGLSGAVRILDAGCGPGADIESFAHLLPEARITGVETHPGFVEEARARLAAHADRVTLLVGDMREAEGPFDLIWCAGALYFLGIGAGLPALGAKLSPGGAVCFTEPVVTDPASSEERAFWEGYPAKDVDGILSEVARSGFAVVAHRRLTEAAWSAYYDPLLARAASLRLGAGPALAAVLDETVAEAEAKRRLGARVGYHQLLVRPA